MKAIRTLSLAVALGLASGAAMASAELAKAKNCLACHTVDKKLIGPAYKDVAAKYANDKEAVNTLVKHIRQGSSGVWGPIPMPPNTQVSEDEARKLAEWVLSTK
jgi:cytochrome c